MIVNSVESNKNNLLNMIFFTWNGSRKEERKKAFMWERRCLK